MNILGVSGAFGHDASACLVIDDQVVSMAEEERFTRQRHAPDALPLRAVTYCLSAGGIDISDIDIVALGWDPDLNHSLPFLAEYRRRLLESSLFRSYSQIEVVPVAHHLCHAASAYASSGWQEGAVLVIDGQGELTSTSIGWAKGNHIEIDQAFPIGQSLGHLYRCLSRAIGFPHFAEGKVMGLAGYGKCELEQLPIRLDENGYSLEFGPIDTNGGTLFELEKQIFSWLEDRGLIFQPELPAYVPQSGRVRFELTIDDRKQNLAARLQADIETVVSHLATLAVSRCGTKNLLFAGGLALNCAANGQLLANSIVDALYVPPVANDSGTSLGAAQWVAMQHGFRPALITPALGPGFSNEQVIRTMNRYGLKYRISDNPAKDAAMLINEGQILGWFQGRCEIGPRALGQRSTLASPAGGLT